MCDRSKDPATFQPMPYQSVRSRGGGSPRQYGNVFLWLLTKIRKSEKAMQLDKRLQAAGWFGIYLLVVFF